MKSLSSKYPNRKIVVELQGKKFVEDFMRCTTHVRLQTLEGYVIAVKMSDVWSIAQKKELHYYISPCPPYRDRMIFF